MPPAPDDRRCEHIRDNGQRCGAWSRRCGPDKDGLRRCIGHSKAPGARAIRNASAELGRAAGREQIGVPGHKRLAVRAKLRAARSVGAAAAAPEPGPAADAPPPILPDRFDVGSTEDQLGLLEAAAHNLVHGHWRPEIVRELRGVCESAARIQGPDADADEERPLALLRMVADREDEPEAA